MIMMEESNAAVACCDVDLEFSIAGQTSSQGGVVGNAGRHTRSVSSTLYRLVGVRIDALPTEDRIAIGATETVVGRGPVGTNQTASGSGVEARAARSNLHALPIISKVLVSVASLLKDTLTVDDVILCCLADTAETNIVDFEAVLRHLDTDTVDTHLVALAHSILETAFAGVVLEPSSYALLAFSGLEVVPLAVLHSIGAGPKAQLLPSHAASDGTADLDADAVGNDFVFVLASEAVTGEGIVGGAEW